MIKANVKPDFDIKETVATDKSQFVKSVDLAGEKANAAK